MLSALAMIESSWIGPGLRRCRACLGVVSFGLLPRCLLRMLDVVIYRAEHNVSEATTVGIVGAVALGWRSSRLFTFALIAKPLPC